MTIDTSKMITPKDALMFNHDEKKNGDHQLSGKVSDGIVNIYYPNGNLQKTGRYFKNKKIGKWTTFYKDCGTKKKTVHYSNGKVVGNVKTWYSSGVLKSKKNNKLTTRYYENGQIKCTGGQKHDLRHGVWTYYSKNGKKVKKVNWAHGLKDGKYTKNNGFTKVTGYYYNGCKVGTWTTDYM